MKTSEEVEKDRDGEQRLNKRPNKAEDFPARIRIFLDQRAAQLRGSSRKSGKGGSMIDHWKKEEPQPPWEGKLRL
jgi:hypothetical protein